MDNSHLHIHDATQHAPSLLVSYSDSHTQALTVSNGINHCNPGIVYHIAGNFRGVQFSRKGNLQRFRGLIFVDGHSRTAPPTIPG